ncbi:MAG: recombinase family protein [Candidatus Sphingomonas colombiensis]|nr:recombinase family protein [Sphingomonas sp.]WEK43190.1 MAG: recombinase family protein [Sphingomonas sp.]
MDRIATDPRDAEKQGWQIVEEYTDHAISGASLLRPGIQALLSDAQKARLDVVLAEAMDRLSEPRRVCRRLQLLRRWSLYEQDNE